ncbi:MAG: 6,7-dimethyl-8-ribityllumazine synthase [Ignavibacteria bacterium]|nr:6,7-dimethyl-8-ribityllumazine synthase [Ignavibacteria bacterium]
MKQKDIKDFKIGLIVSEFNKPVTDKLLEGASTALSENGINENQCEIFHVPGAFEIPAVLKKLSRENIDKEKFDGILTIGCVIKGETAHFDYISSTVTDSINKISYEYEMPVGFCVLTCYTPQQAFERSLTPATAENNKGYEAAMSLLEMIRLLNKI